MRRISFSATTEQMWAGTKTVTRRDPATWRHLAPGDRLTAIEKGMGLAAGERQVVIGVIEIVSNEVMALEPVVVGWRAWQADEARREGFGSWAEFVATWQRLHGRFDPSAMVRRIEFRHVDHAGQLELEAS